MDYIFKPASQVSLPIRGTDAQFPVRRIYCIGRNYADHAIEMGHDPDREAPFFSRKMHRILISAERFLIRRKQVMCITKSNWWSR